MDKRGKRQRTEAVASAPLSARHATAVERIARELAELAGAAPNVPQLAECSAQLATLLVQQQQQQPGTTGAMAAAGAFDTAAVAPFDLLPDGVVELVLLHCDARSLGRMGCASRFFGGGQQRSLVERVATSPSRLHAVLAPALRPHEVASRTLQLWRHEHPVAMDASMLRELAELHSEAPGRRDEAARFYRRALEAEPEHENTLFNFAQLLMMSREPSELSEAEALCRRVLVLVYEEYEVDVLDVLGYILSKDPERLDEAVQVLRRAQEIEPDNSSPQASIAVCLSARGGAGDLAEALQLCQQAVAGAALEDAGAHANALLAHGIVLVRSGDAVAARAKLVEAQGLDVIVAVANPYFTDLSLLLEQHVAVQSALLSSR